MKEHDDTVELTTDEIVEVLEAQPDDKICEACRQQGRTDPATARGDPMARSSHSTCATRITTC